MLPLAVMLRLVWLTPVYLRRISKESFSTQFGQMLRTG